MKRTGSKGLVLCVFAITIRLWCFPPGVLSAKTTNSIQANQEVLSTPQSASPNQNTPQANLETAEDWNRRLKKLLDSNPSAPAVSAREYRIGSEDVLNINIFEAQELNREVRVSASGDISLPLMGSIRAAGLTPGELEFVLQELLHRTYMKDPHVSVFVREMQSHPVSVMGAVRRPGVFQIRGSKTLLEVLSLAEGLADDAGESVIILRGAALSTEPEPAVDRSGATNQSSSAAQNTVGVKEVAPGLNSNRSASENVVQVNLKDLLESDDSRSNPLVHPGDIVKVTRAGVVYVIGEVRRPGGFALKSNERISVLQALALSEGLTRTAAKAEARIIRTDQQSGEREETPINLGKILAGKAPDPILDPKDIVFVPNSAAKSTLSRGAEIAAQTLTGLLIFHW
ncbi:MAG TPA: polysaccharide biosynthesis/export family protein [Candidatus Polarisedimenticolia bacterium]|nr:polysaccharide biosynthesis/export family protein [Candidatus Polarisedimenticolia bacterium]